MSPRLLIFLTCLLLGFALAAFAHAGILARFFLVALNQ